jgi:hypothetical protein
MRSATIGLGTSNHTSQMNDQANFDNLINGGH